MVTVLRSCFTAHALETTEELLCLRQGFVSLAPPPPNPPHPPPPPTTTTLTHTPPPHPTPPHRAGTASLIFKSIKC